MSEGECAIWGTQAKERSEGENIIFCDSPRAGGKYKISQSAISKKRKFGQELSAKYTTWLIDQRLSGVDCPELIYDNLIESISRQKLLSTSERLGRFFKYLSVKNYRIGEAILPMEVKHLYGSQVFEFEITQQYYELMAFTESFDGVEMLNVLNYLEDSGYVKRYVKEDMHGFVEGKSSYLTPKGLEKIDELSSKNTNSQQVFVAMWFDPSLDDLYELGIKPAIKDAGYDPLRISEKSHNNKIDDEIIAEIRRSKFLIADFTSSTILSKDDKVHIVPRGGVYYEAGFAKGLGLEVIWTCRKDCFSDIHFDTRQFNHIVWENIQDLRKQLYDRIRAVIT